MIKKILEKWFGLEPYHCETCEILRLQLDESNKERRELLHKLLDKDKTEPLSTTSKEELTPIKPQFIPWRLRQQMLEQEDRVKARLTKDRVEEIAALEKELGVGNEAQTGKIVVK